MSHIKRINEMLGKYGRWKSVVDIEREYASPEELENYKKVLAKLLPTKEDVIGYLYNSSLEGAIQNDEEFGAGGIIQTSNEFGVDAEQPCAEFLEILEQWVKDLFSK